jgi:hypothetical protein
MSTIAQLAQKLEKLQAEIRAVREEIASRHGEVDAPVQHAVKATKTKKATKAS